MKKSFLLIPLILIVAFVSCLTLAGCNKGDGRYYVSQNTRFEIQTETSVMKLPVMLVMDSSDTFVELRTDGTMTMRFKVAAGIIDLAKTFFKIDLSEKIAGTDITPITDTYANELCPGFTLDDIPYSLSLLEKSIGIKITGIDFEDDNIIELCNSLKKDGTVPIGFKIPDIGIEYNGPYYLKEVSSEFTGKTYTGVFMGKHEKNGQPFTVMTLSTDKESLKKVLKFRIEFVQIDLTAIEIKN